MPSVPLPPYEPDGSLPPLPLADVPAKDLIARYEVSKQTLYTRLSAVGVTGTKRGKLVFFNQEEVFRMDAGHHFLSKGYGLKDLKEACGGGSASDEVVDIRDEVTAPAGGQWSTPSGCEHQRPPGVLGGRSRDPQQMTQQPPSTPSVHTP